ncbi:Membrane-bound lytic murein transglycosylase D precursor [uncultured Candidatus Thioglobus sp.]|nr:Membrane-bound lytic murein transglycosylase D precursor [uncultured Candidatus Thioglobus sp.]
MFSMYRKNSTYILQNLLVCAFVFLVFIQQTVSAEIYRYTDSYERVTFTDKPDSDKHVKLVKTWKGWVPEKKSSIRYKNSAENKRRHADMIDSIAKNYKLPRSLIHAVITAESAYDSEAVSRAGAVGLMQLMGATAKRYDVKNRRDPYENVRGGTEYLRDLLNLFDNDLRLALAAYNAGEGAVKKYNYQVPPYKETQAYVKKVLSLYSKYRKLMS